MQGRCIPSPKHQTLGKIVHQTYKYNNAGKLYTKIINFVRVCLILICSISLMKKNCFIKANQGELTITDR